jgi:hypothetical protein
VIESEYSFDDFEEEPQVEKPNDQQQALFDDVPFWASHWGGMPEYIQENLMPLQTVNVHFARPEDREAFAYFMGQAITDKTKSIWYPAVEMVPAKFKRWRNDPPVDPKYPVYVISKGRWDSRQTIKALEEIKVDFKVVIEPQEYFEYAAVVDPDKILTLPFSNLGQGSIPARNWVWEHSMSIGAKRHWILDDNIRKFVRLHDNMKIEVDSGVMFRAAEDFTDRYENIQLSGFQYFMFAPRKSKLPAFVRNTRIYSCILIDNSIPFRWRGRYNEDTDLSIRVLKEGGCTVLFNAFLADKTTTMTMGGGNTEDLYEVDDGRLKMAQSLVDQHPDVVCITEKWGRKQHQVNYRIFKSNKMVLKPGIKIPQDPDNYGMELDDSETTITEESNGE